jgi:hypothetical protein
MNLIRVQAGLACGIDTHKWSVFGRILKECDYTLEKVVVDPFARNCPLGGRWTNDINPTTSSMYHLPAQEFLESVPTNTADILIFDPPFSNIQAERKYGEGANLYTEPGTIKALMIEINRVLKPGGIMIKFGYNSSRHFNAEFVRGYAINFGGNRNDVLCTVWRNVQTTLFT